jgi:hypothetical protein
MDKGNEKGRPCKAKSVLKSVNQVLNLGTLSNITAIEILAASIVEVLGEEEAKKVFEHLNGGGDVNSDYVWCNPSSLIEHLPDSERQSTFEPVTRVLKGVAGVGGVTNLAVGMMGILNNDSEEESIVSAKRSEVILPQRPARKTVSSLKGKKKAVSKPEGIDTEIMDGYGIQADGTINKEVKRVRYDISVNGLGTCQVGASSKHVETAATKGERIKELAEVPVSSALIGLALVFGKTMPKHYARNAWQTVQIFREEMKNSFDEFLGLRWWTLELDAKVPVFGLSISYV